MKIRISTISCMVLCILLYVICTSGCAGAILYRDTEGRPYRIKSTGIFPVKATLDGNEIDTRMSIFDVNVVKGG